MFEKIYNKIGYKYFDWYSLNKNIKVRFTLRKLLNMFLVKLSKSLRLVKVLGLPYKLNLEPTNVCNLACPLCPSNTTNIREKTAMSFEQFKRIIDQIGWAITTIQMYHFGETFLAKDVFKMIDYAYKNKIAIFISSNLNLSKGVMDKILDSKLSKLIISLDGSNQKVYSKYRVNGSFSKVITNVKYLIKKKKELNKQTPLIVLQFIVMKHNEHDIENIKTLAKKLGVDDLLIKKVLLLAKDDYSFLPENFDNSRYLKQGNKYKKIDAGINFCDGVYDQPIICSNGEVVPCCYVNNKEIVLGNVYLDKFNKIWNGNKYTALRKKILKNKNSINLCKGCPGSIQRNYLKKVKK